ncbi:hypothetical protein FRC08_017625, partial [Ceratobasidium sp. 394]
MPRIVPSVVSLLSAIQGTAYQVSTFTPMYHVSVAWSAGTWRPWKEDAKEVCSPHTSRVISHPGKVGSLLGEKHFSGCATHTVGVSHGAVVERVCPWM